MNLHEGTSSAPNLRRRLATTLVALVRPIAGAVQWPPLDSTSATRTAQGPSDETLDEPLSWAATTLATDRERAFVAEVLAAALEDGFINAAECSSRTAAAREAPTRLLLSSTVLDLPGELAARLLHPGTELGSPAPWRLPPTPRQLRRARRASAYAAVRSTLRSATIARCTRLIARARVIDEGQHLLAVAVLGVVLCVGVVLGLALGLALVQALI